MYAYTVEVVRLRLQREDFGELMETNESIFEGKGNFGGEESEVECYLGSRDGPVVSFVTRDWSIGDAMPNEEIL